MATAYSLLRRMGTRTPTSTSCPEPIDNASEDLYHRPDPEYMSRREAAYRANSDYNSNDSVVDAGTPSRPDSGVFPSPDDASSIYSNDDAKQMTPGYYSQEGSGVSDRFVHRAASDVSYAAPVEELSYGAAQAYDVSDLQQKFGMSSPPAAMGQAAPGDIAGPAPQAVDSSAPVSIPSSSRIDSAQSTTSSKKSPPNGAKEGKGAENPDAVPVAGGIKLGSKAKEWGDWRERMLKEAEEAGPITEEVIKAAEEAEKAEQAGESAEAEELPKSKSTTSFLKKFRSIAGRKRSGSK